MSTIQRRNSQRLASALEALTSDLDMDVTASEVETDENIVSAGLSP
jgi:EAL domain-containing protein (putative c-di-GMP-specific phosphodiesterase class I)